MNRPMLSFFCALLMGAYSVSALAADSRSADATPYGQEARAQVDAKRDQISGAAQIAAPAKKGPSAMLDAPVDTDDAPAQVQKP